MVAAGTGVWVIGTQVNSRRRIIAAGVIGNMLEWYDFSIYGFFAVQIGATFFHTQDRVAEVLAAFGVFALGSIARPVGSIIIGSIGDRKGRATALTISIVGMAISTVGMGLLPGYASIGVAAPVLLTLMRLLQGLAVGGEASIAGVFMIENAPTGRRALSAAIGGVGNGLGIQLGSLTALAFASLMTPEQLNDWGWRLPFVLSVLVGAAGFFIRRELLELPRPVHVEQSSPLLETVRNHFGLLMRIAALASFAAIGFQAAFIYIAEWLQRVNGVSPADTFKVTSLSMLCPFGPAEKQALLEAADSTARARLLTAFLEMGAFGDQPQSTVSRH